MKNKTKEQQQQRCLKYYHIGFVHTNAFSKVPRMRFRCQRKTRRSIRVHAIILMRYRLSSLKRLDQFRYIKIRTWLRGLGE